MFLLVDNYDSFTFNLYALFKTLNADIKVIKNSEFVSAEKFKGIILSPGPSNPSNSGTTLKYLENYLGKKPIFGVCLGMQAIGYALGFNIKHAKTVMHGKSDRINIYRKVVLFKNMSNFNAVRYHSLAVNIDEQHRYVTGVAKSDKEIMAMEDIDKKFFGVQFHPESFLSDNGKTIVENFLKFVAGGM